MNPYTRVAGLGAIVARAVLAAIRCSLRRRSTGLSAITQGTNWQRHFSEDASQAISDKILTPGLRTPALSKILFGGWTSENDSCAKSKWW